MWQFFFFFFFFFFFWKKGLKRCLTSRRWPHMHKHKTASIAFLQKKIKFQKLFYFFGSIFFPDWHFFVLSCHLISLFLCANCCHSYETYLLQKNVVFFFHSELFYSLLLSGSTRDAFSAQSLSAKFSFQFFIRNTETRNEKRDNDTNKKTKRDLVCLPN